MVRSALCSFRLSRNTLCLCHTNSYRFAVGLQDTFVVVSQSALTVANQIRPHFLKFTVSLQTKEYTFLNKKMLLWQLQVSISTVTLKIFSKGEIIPIKFKYSLSNKPLISLDYVAKSGFARWISFMSLWQNIPEK